MAPRALKRPKDFTAKAQRRKGRRSNRMDRAKRKEIISQGDGETVSYAAPH